MYIIFQNRNRWLFSQRLFLLWLYLFLSSSFFLFFFCGKKETKKPPEKDYIPFSGWFPDRAFVLLYFKIYKLKQFSFFAFYDYRLITLGLKRKNP
jgi:hypothetical protein